MYGMARRQRPAMAGDHGISIAYQALQYTPAVKAGGGDEREGARKA